MSSYNTGKQLQGPRGLDSILLQLHKSTSVDCADSDAMCILALMVMRILHCPPCHSDAKQYSVTPLTQDLQVLID